MKIFRFDPEIGTGADKFGSVKAIIAKVIDLESDAAVNVAYIRPMERIVSHQAAASQLFLLVEGEGWARNESEEIFSLREGQAMYWEEGEWHESGSETGMTAVIIEGINFDLAKLMPLLQKDEP
jgi:quercetin dioxygenase-like cupin family protein